MNASRKIAVLSSCVGWAVDYQDVPFSRRSICPIKKLMNFQFLNEIWKLVNLRFEINFTLRPFLWKWSLWKIDNIIFKIKFYFHIGSIHIETENGSKMVQNWPFSLKNWVFWLQNWAFGLKSGHFELETGFFTSKIHTLNSLLDILHLKSELCDCVPVTRGVKELQLIKFMREHPVHNSKWNECSKRMF